MEEPRYDVVWPLGKSVCETAPLARGVPDLQGKKVCEVWDWLFRGDEIFPLLRELMSNLYPGIEFIDYTAFGDTHGAKEREVVAALPGRLHEYGCDAVISGVGA